MNCNTTHYRANSSSVPGDPTRQEILDLAGSLLFSGDDLKKRVSVLSGGEKSRVALGKILLKRSPCLLLDEPTNHLDFQTVEALTQALAAYEGTVVVVSHDRGFVGRVATKILEVRSGKVELYPGTYDEYVWSLEKGALADRAVAPAEQKSQPKGIDARGAANGGGIAAPRAANYKEERKRIERQIRQSEKAMEDATARIERNRARMEEVNTLLVSAAGPDAGALAKELGLLQRECDELESAWFARGEEKDRFETELRSLTGE